MTTLLSVFDVAGTTVKDDDAVAKALLEAVAEWATPHPSQICAVMGLPKPIAIRRVLSEELTGPELEVAVARAHEAFEDGMVEHYLSHPDVAPIDGTEEAFARLQGSGCLVALDTGFSRRILNAILERLGWHEGGTIDLSTGGVLTQLSGSVLSADVLTSTSGLTEQTC